MKKIITIFLLFLNVLLSLHAEDINFIVTNNCLAKSCENGNNKKNFKKNDKLIFTYESLLDYYNFEISLKNPKDGNWYVFSKNSVKPYNYRNKLSTSISKNIWIPSYYYDLLTTDGKLTELLKLEPFWNEWENYTDNESLTWEDDFAIQRYFFDDYTFSIKTNATRWIGPDSIALIKEISSDKIVYEIQAVFTGIYRKKSDNLYNYPYFKTLLTKHTPFYIILAIDGDYIKLYINEVSEKNLFQTLIRTNPKLCNQIEKYIKSDVYDLSDIVWPHHADGTSEYEDTIRYPEQIAIEELEQTEVEEYDNTDEETTYSDSQADNIDCPPFPSKEDSKYWDILEQYYPEDYEKLRFEYLQKRTKVINTVVISCSIIFGIIIIIAVVFTIIRKQRTK